VTASAAVRPLPLFASGPLSLKARLLRATSWSVAAAVVAQGLAFLVAVLTGRLLGPAVYGRVGLVQSTIGMAGVFAELGASVTATRYTAELRAVDPERVGRVLAMARVVAAVAGLLLTVALLACAAPLAGSRLHSADVAPLLRLAAPLLLLNAWNGVQSGTLSGLEDFRGLATVNFWRGLASVPIVLVGVLQFGAAGAVAAPVLVGVLAAGLYARRISGRCRMPLSQRRLVLLISSRGA
jgi:O-antigen/teichoic acid export membrane protein